MIKLSDFATISGVSKRAVQISLKKYETELEGHFERQGQNGTYLDAYAQEFLRSKMLKNPVVVYDEKTLPFYDELQATRKENDELQKELAEAYKQLANVGEMRFQLQAQIIELKVLSAGKDEAERRAAEAEKEIVSLVQQKVEAQEERDAAIRRADAADAVAEANGQEAEREKQRASDAEAEIEKISSFSIFDFMRFKRSKRREGKRSKKDT